APQLVIDVATAPSMRPLVKYATTATRKVATAVLPIAVTPRATSFATRPGSCVKNAAMASKKATKNATTATPCHQTGAPPLALSNQQAEARGTAPSQVRTANFAATVWLKQMKHATTATATI